MNENEERLVEVKLIGELGRKFRRTYQFWVRNPRDVISALARQIEGFKEYLATAHENGVGFRLVTDDPIGIDYQGLLISCERLVIAPIVSGAGDVGRILLGVALVALSFVSFGAGTAFAGILSAAPGIGSSVLFSIGASLIFTGLAALLTPPVRTPRSDNDKKESYLFDRAAELTTQGYPIPVLYGEFTATAPLVVSSSISTEQIPV